MVWERIKRISEAEPDSSEHGVAQVQLELVELLGGLEARDPGGLSVRFAETAGGGRDRQEADRAEHELSNKPGLLVENEANALSRPIDAPLCAALLKAGGVDKRS